MREKVYIISSAQISAQEPFCSVDRFVPVPWEEGMLPCKDPDFKPFISPMAARRMNSILKRSIAVSRQALQDASIQCPDAIVTGTGNGCVADTEVFLTKMLEDGETMLNPSKFICSTPNTIGSQIAITLGCRGFNSTHVNDRFAFEGALLDSMMLLESGNCKNVLLCTSDQLTQVFYSLVDRETIWKGLPVSEGSVAFVLSSDPQGAVCQIEDLVQTRSNPIWELDGLFSRRGLTWNDIDIVLTSSFPGKSASDFPFLPSDKPVLEYKQYCGQYLSASAFGMFAGSGILRGKGGRALLAGRSKDTYSFILISSNLS